MYTVKLEALKVSKSREQFMVSSILPKNERWDNFMYWKLSQCSFFGRIEDTIICFPDCLTFTKSRLEAYAGFFRLSMKGKFDVYLFVTFWDKVDFLIINTRYYSQLYGTYRPYLASTFFCVCLFLSFSLQSLLHHT